MRVVVSAFIASLLVLSTLVVKAETRKADLLLILAIDVSQSIDADEYKIQKDGYVAALSDPEITDLLSRNNGTGLIIFEWSKKQHLLVDCLHIRKPQDAVSAAQIVSDANRGLTGSTAVGEAMAFAETLIRRCPINADEIVLDISGDGKDNQHQPSGSEVSEDDRPKIPSEVRDRLVAAGWRINTLPIDAYKPVSYNDPTTVLEWFQTNINGGEGNFSMPVESFDQLAGQLRRKLIQEISQARRSRYALAQ